MGWFVLERSITIQPSLRACRKLVKRTADLTNPYVKDEQDLYEIRLALTEALSNIVLHAFANRKKGKIKLRLQLYPQGFLRIMLIDQGKPFTNPEANIRIASGQSESGRGLYLISCLMDDFSYRHFRRQNILILDKRLSRSLKWKD